MVHNAPTAQGQPSNNVSEAKARIAEIDAMFDEATGWGSWMIMAANEREYLATTFGLEQKWQARCGGRRTS